MTGKVTLDMVLENIWVQYPSLYNHIFAKEDILTNVSRFELLIKFLKEHNATHIIMNMSDIWEYISSNEDLHDWWML